VKKVFGFEGDREIGQQTYPRTWLAKYSKFVLESVNGIPSYGPDGFKTNHFLEPYQGRIQALTEVLSFKQGRKYASIELLEYLISAEDEGNLNWAPFMMESFRRQMNLVKKKDKHLTNFKGAEWVDVLLRQFWPDDELVEGVESEEEVESSVEVEGNDSSVPCQPLPVLIPDTPSTDCDRWWAATYNQQTVHT
jgi:hypothetical protein